MAKTAEQIRAEISALEAELRKQEEAERKAAMADDAKSAIALIASMRSAMSQIEKMFPGTFDDERWKSVPWPRSTKFKRLAGLSETEVHEAQERGKDVRWMK